MADNWTLASTFTSGRSRPFFILLVFVSSRHAGRRRRPGAPRSGRDDGGGLSKRIARATVRCRSDRSASWRRVPAGRDAMDATNTVGGGGVRVSAGDYGLLVMLMLMNVLNFVDRQLLSSFANFIVPDLGLSNGQFGLLTGLVFLVFYAVAGLFMGALADLVHRPRLIAGAMFVWSALTAASGLARGFLSLALPRVFIGIGESALTPTAMSLLADRFPPEKRGFASGFYYIGVPLGVGVSLLVAGVLGPKLGWRNCFLLLGAIGVVFSFAILAVRETRPSR
ncbi:MAG: MFS transporter, partial [Caulobacteraceae bacterium]